MLWIACLAPAMVLPALCGTASAQSTGGALSTLVPAPQVTVDDAAGDAPAARIPTGGAGTLAPPSLVSGDASTDPNAAPILPRGKFAPPKGQAKTQDRIKLPRKGPPPLPPLLPYPTALRQRGGVPIADTALTIAVPAPSVAALPVPVRQKARVPDDGYAPLGVQAGSLIVTPAITQSLGFDSNPDQTQTGVKPSAFSRTEGEVGLQSNWSANELKADLRGGYNDYFNDPQASRPDAVGTVDLRLDVDRDTTVDAEQRFSVDTQRPGSPELNINAVTRPLIIGFGDTLGATETIGRTSIGVHGSFDRVAYDNAVLSNSSIQDLANENYNDYGFRVRVAYEITPVIKPFVDMLVDERLHDATVDLNGFRRDSMGFVAQAGSSFEFNHLFSGEFSAGYGTRSYDDSRLKNLDGPVFNAAIRYAVTPLTVLSLQGATTFDETTVPGSSGSKSTSVTLTATHQLLRNFTLTGAVSYLNTDYTGVPITENTLSETLKAEYHLSRTLVATAAYNHQKLDSTASGSSFDQNVFLVGLRVQR